MAASSGTSLPSGSATPTTRLPARSTTRPQATKRPLSVAWISPRSDGPPRPPDFLARVLPRPVEGDARGMGLGVGGRADFDQLLDLEVAVAQQLDHLPRL